MIVFERKTIGSALIVAGTTIGAGMLALPIIAGTSGFFYSIALFVICFLFMFASLFVFLEANLYCEVENANILTITKTQLGPVAEVIAGLCFLLLLYAAAAAYISAGGTLITELLNANLPLHLHLSNYIGIAIFLAFFDIIVFFGTAIVDHANQILMAFLLISYVSLLFFLTPHIKVTHLEHSNPKLLLAAVPVVIVSFTSHIIVPSIKDYMQGDTKQLVRALFIGNVIPLVCYILWQLVTVGVLPLTTIQHISISTHPVEMLTSSLAGSLNVTDIIFWAGSFSFFALVTSFMGVSLSLTDFLADGFKMKKTVVNRLLLIVGSYLPPLLFALFLRHGFILALSYAGVFVAILYGILPVLMVWKARYRDGRTAAFRVIGGKTLLLLIFFGAIAVIFFQIATTLHWLPGV